MEDQQQQSQTAQPATTMISVEGLQALYGQLGEQAHVIHELRAQLTKLKRTADALLEHHQPGRCVPVEAEPDATTRANSHTDDPVPLARASKGG